jgi:Dolichyl-phosphate-mannose-protein mannosyltransferase
MTEAQLGCRPLEAMRAAIRRNPLVWLTVLVLGLVYVFTAGRYDIFRNELYFIACGRHPAFGYADLPPVVPLVAAASQVFGVNVWVLRLPAVLAALVLIPLTAQLARTVGGDERAAWLAAIAVAIAPGLLALSSTLGPSAFEPVGWTLCAWLLARAILNGKRKSLIWAGVVAGIGFETKYGIAIWLLGLSIGILSTSARRLLYWRESWYAGAAAVVLGAPSLVWQQLHGWPFLATIGFATAHRNLTGSPVRFEVGQLLAMNFLLSPLWIAGIVSPIFVERLKPVRFLSLAFVVTSAAVIYLRGKDYYLFPAYPTMFAVGAVACAELGRAVRGIWYLAAIALALPVLPVVLPILDPAALARYLDKTHLRPRPVEIEGIGAPLTQVFSDELGWREMEKQVALAYRSLPPQDRSRAAIMTQNYGEAAALDLYGPEDGLPPSVCGQLQYYFWGTHGFDGSVIIHVNGDPQRWSEMCRESKVVDRFGAPLAMPYEHGPIILCNGLLQPLPEMWSRFKRER